MRQLLCGFAILMTLPRGAVRARDDVSYAVRQKEEE